MIDLTRPLMLRDGTRVHLFEDVDTTTFARPSVSIALAEPDRLRREPDLFAWQGDNRGNAIRSFFIDTGRHVFDWTKDEVVNVIDWSQPIELDDGTPLRVVGGTDGLYVDIRLAWASYTHSAFPIDRNKGSANRVSGLVISNHNFHVRNRTMIKTIDTTKPLQLPGSDKAVTFVTETSDGNILVDVQAYGWAVFDKQGKFVRAKDGYGYSLGLINKVERFVGYQCIGQVTKGYIMAAVYSTESEARRLGKQVVRVTSEDGRVVSVELLS